MTVKIIAVIVGIAVLIIGVYDSILKSKNKKIKELDKKIKDLTNAVEANENTINSLRGELEIEQKHKNKLVKRLADISSMSINDVIQQLQND